MTTTRWNQCPDCHEQDNVIRRNPNPESGHGDDHYFACKECGTTWRAVIPVDAENWRRHRRKINDPEYGFTEP